MTVDIPRVPCYGCGLPFPVWANEWFCSDACRDAYPDEWPKVASWIRVAPGTVILGDGDDGLRSCSRCGDRVGYLSSRDLCDGCEEEKISSEEK